MHGTLQISSTTRVRGGSSVLNINQILRIAARNSHFGNYFVSFCFVERGVIFCLLFPGFKHMTSLASRQTNLRKFSPAFGELNSPKPAYRGSFGFVLRADQHHTNYTTADFDLLTLDLLPLSSVLRDILFREYSWTEVDTSNFGQKWNGSSFGGGQISKRHMHHLVTNFRTTFRALSSLIPLVPEYCPPPPHTNHQQLPTILRF